MNLILLVLSIMNLACLLFLLGHTEKVIDAVKDDTWYIVNSVNRELWQEIEKLKRKIEEMK